MSPWATSRRRTSDGQCRRAFDYVIVGAGSAGCVLADRLTESGEHSVLLLEYGGSDRSIYIQMPAALSIPMNMPRYNWFFHTEPEPGLGGRQPAYAARQGAGWIILHQRAGLCQGQSARFRALGVGRARAAGPTATYCLTSSARSGVTGRGRLSRRRGQSRHPLRPARQPAE